MSTDLQDGRPVEHKQDLEEADTPGILPESQCEDEDGLSPALSTTRKVLLAGIMSITTLLAVSFLETSILYNP